MNLRAFTPFPVLASITRIIDDAETARRRGASAWSPRRRPSAVAMILGVSLPSRARQTSKLVWMLSGGGSS